MTTPMDLYGTTCPPPASEQQSVGKLSFTLQDGALRHITYDGVELIRGIALLVRDQDWGTLAPRITEVSRDTSSGLGLTLRMLYQSHGATLEVSLTIAADEAGLRVSATGQADAPFETNRAGFTILHPASVAGCPVEIGHSCGKTETSVFPILIDPWQPFMDIVSLTHERAGFRVRCALAGDTFEMEDQRQWGDASFKTYNRPLALPWPYTLDPGERLEQSVHLTWARCPTPRADTAPRRTEGARFPDTALVLTAEDALRLAQSPEDIAAVAPQRLLCHIDAARGDTAKQIENFAALQTALPDLIYDAELICLFARTVARELSARKQAMDAVGFIPDSVLVCPSVDRQSTPPGSEWPHCPPLADIHAKAARVFEGTLRGAGMVSFFPELNRKRPPLEHVSFVSHGLCPIVHAADDLSVMETLEAVPDITRTARAIIGDRDYRIGPATIAMRQNPYGNRTIPNPDHDRICMTDDDPRHRAAFGAAYTLGLATALAQADVSVWTPAALYGPRGLSGPIATVIAALAKCAGQTVHRARITGGLATLDVGTTRFQANLTATENSGLAPYAWRNSQLDAPAETDVYSL
ncbi:hypothetical protein [Phaeobacter sp. B1627]|uniref:hypothetical protein n=1 Tax=Phaeobacter sp. B1627 TaxID=2583809 RepID=UPI0011199A9E|nr:hypothetical protein [Phaeobacter sp. B1627]TNJ39952.1 hypothetical protein FGE21_18495 [Phaeobacter sp. B1627]